MPRKAKVCALDRLLLERFGGKAGWGVAAESRGRSRLSARTGSLFARVLTGRSGEGESFAERRDNEHMQTNVCDATKGVRIVCVEAWPGRGVERDVWRYRRLGRGCPERSAGCGRRASLLEDRGEGTR
jgi:hypothetical protein